jgi:folate-binding Fe-S cluster repair protein YgfZ
VVARTSQRIVRRPRAFVAVTGPAAADYLQRMVSNDVESLEPGQACDALLLTPKARIIAPLRVLRRGADDFLLLTEPELGERVAAELTRMRFAARCEIAREKHESWLVLDPPGTGAAGVHDHDHPSVAFRSPGPHDEVLTPCGGPPVDGPDVVTAHVLPQRVELGARPAHLDRAPPVELAEPGEP